MTSLDLTTKIDELLQKQDWFVAVRVYEGLDAETALVVTQDEVFGHVDDPVLRQKLTETARKTLVNQKSRNERFEVESGRIKAFFEFFAPQETILVAGAGHIAVSLCKLATAADFCVTVLDDREDYANAERFPDAQRILTGSFADMLRNYPLNTRTYVVIVTRGHTHDKDCLLEVLDRSVAYIGMIGSRRRLAAVFELMKQQGVKRENLSRVHAPIGLPLGGNTPEAIAVSILAEIISVRYRGKDWSLSMKSDFCQRPLD